MSDFAAAVLAAFGVVFLAELGDKTQLLAVGFGAQHPVRRVIIGLAIGYGAAGLVAVAIGGLLGANLPQRPIEIVGGLVFIAFGILTLRADGPGSGASTDHDEIDTSAPTRSVAGPSAALTVGLAIFVAEMGDKTQIATATLAARSDPVATWLGATAGAVASGTLGVAVGSMIGDRIPPAVMKWVAAALFVAFGAALLAGWP